MQTSACARLRRPRAGSRTGRWIAAGLCLAHLHAVTASADSGYQVINGTRVFTVIDHANKVATFSNECGSQTLTQGELQGGAIPDQIIPCPRPESRAPPPPPPVFTPRSTERPPREAPIDLPRESPATVAYDRALAQESRCNHLAEQSKHAEAAKCFAAAEKLYAAARDAGEDAARMRRMSERMRAAIQPSGASLPSPSPSRSAAGGKQLAEGCVTLGRPRLVSAMCDFKEGHKLYYTPVKTNPIEGCPREIIVEYLDPETKKLQTWVANRSGTNIETCTAGVAAVRPRAGQ